VDATELKGRLAERREAAERLLRELVDEPSGSHFREGVARAVERLARELADIGFAVELVKDRGLPRHLVARRVARDLLSPRVLLVGHADTVFPPSDTRRFAVDGERYRGPGAADMKGGLVVALEALRALGPDVLSGLEVEVLVNGDEELGSPHSRELVRERARGARAALVFENSEDEAAVIVGRKGLGRATISIRGRAAHAGIEPEKGVSAIVEMAREILAISELADPARGLSVIVGTARGGTSRNTVPAEAEFEVDLRYREKEDGRRALATILDIVHGRACAGIIPRTDAELHRPPMDPHGAGGALLPQAERCARALGVEIRGIATGGGSDANLTADLGVPTLDGLGVVGGEIHTSEEWCLARSVQSRAALAALLLHDIAASSRISP
jgi:glutamate carboxypeptidase